MKQSAIFASLPSRGAPPGAISPRTSSCRASASFLRAGPPPPSCVWCRPVRRRPRHSRGRRSRACRRRSAALIEHPAVLALIRIVAVLQRAKLARRDVERAARLGRENSGRAKRPRRNRPTSRGRSAPRKGCRAQAGRRARALPPRTGDRRRMRRHRCKGPSVRRRGPRAPGDALPRPAPRRAESAAFRALARRSYGR